MGGGGAGGGRRPWPAAAAGGRRRPAVVRQAVAGVGRRTPPRLSGFMNNVPCALRRSASVTFATPYVVKVDLASREWSLGTLFM